MFHVCLLQLGMLSALGEVVLCGDHHGRVVVDAENVVSIGILREQITGCERCLEHQRALDVWQDGLDSRLPDGQQSNRQVVCSRVSGIGGLVPIGDIQSI